MASDEKRAVVISYNWLTNETLHTAFEGDGCGEQAATWVHPKSFIWRDFPPSKGWTHFAHFTDSAGKEYGEKKADEFIRGETVERWLK